MACPPRFPWVEAPSLLAADAGTDTLQCQEVSPAFPRRWKLSGRGDATRIIVAYSVDGMKRLASRSTWVGKRCPTRADTRWANSIEWRPKPHGAVEHAGAGSEARDGGDPLHVARPLRERTARSGTCAVIVVPPRRTRRVLVERPPWREGVLSSRPMEGRRVRAARGGRRGDLSHLQPLVLNQRPIAVKGDPNGEIAHGV